MKIVVLTSHSDVNLYETRTNFQRISHMKEVYRYPYTLSSQKSLVTVTYVRIFEAVDKYRSIRSIVFQSI